MPTWESKAPWSFKGDKEETPDHEKVMWTCACNDTRDKMMIYFDEDLDQIMIYTEKCGLSIWESFKVWMRILRGGYQEMYFTREDAKRLGEELIKASDYKPTKT